jgi:hypothetical protein
MPDLARWEDMVKDLRTDAKRARERSDEIERNDGKDKGYGVAIGEAHAFKVAADRIDGELEELRHA